MPFRDSILAVSPPFLTEEGGTSEAIQYAEGTVMDGVAEWMIESVLASMPGVGTPDALYLIGRDMQIDRGPNETDDHYAVRLQRAVDSHRVKGSGPELLKQLFSWFSPSTLTPIRLVSNSATWHEINVTTEVVTKTVVGTNWAWDANVATAAGTLRGWVIIDMTAGPWTPRLWGDGRLWGSGVWGASNATPAQVSSLRRIIDTWKPAHITCANIIITFTATIFERTDASPPNPDGTSDTSAWRIGYNALFGDGV
jgi:hypothetical protein